MDKKIPYSFVNEADVLKRLGGNVNLFNRLFVKYIEQCSGSDEKVRSMLAAEQFDDAHMLVHNIKGTSANMGITCMWEASSNLDKALKERNMEKIPALCDVFCSTLQKIIDEATAAN